MTETAKLIDPMTEEMIDRKELAEALPEQACEQGVSLLGPGGLLTGLTNKCWRRRLASTSAKCGTAGRERKRSQQDPARNLVHRGRPPVEINVHGDRDGNFEPQIVKKRQRRLDGTDEVLLPDARPERSRRTSMMSPAPPSQETPSAGSPRKSWRRWPNGPTGPLETSS